jgi:hypothetical protein
MILTVLWASRGGLNMYDKYCFARMGVRRRRRKGA